jgi:hypothetical protein
MYEGMFIHSNELTNWTRPSRNVVHPLKKPMFSATASFLIRNQGTSSCEIYVTSITSELYDIMQALYASAEPPFPGTLTDASHPRTLLSIAAIEVFNLS